MCVYMHNIFAVHLYRYCVRVICAVHCTLTYIYITMTISICIEIVHSFTFMILGNEVKDGDIRLVGGRYLWEGRVEIFLSGVWGTISHDWATSTGARIVCRQLGYNTYSKV